MLHDPPPQPPQRPVSLRPTILPLAVLAVGFAACAPRPEGTNTGTPAAAGVVAGPGPAAPRRIVSLNCNATDVLVALDAMDQVVAVEEDCPTCGAEGKVLVRNDDHLGKTKPLSIEAVLALQPDAVLVRSSLEELFANCGVRVLATPQRLDLTTLPDYVRAVGALVGREERAENVLDAMARKAEHLRERCAKLPKVRVYYETTSLGQTATKRSVMHAMIELAGGINIAEDIDRQTGRMTNEAIVAADPEVIVLSPFADPIEAVVERPGWDGLSAVRRGRVHRLPLEHRYVALATPRCVDGCERFLVPWLHPELEPEAARR